MRRTAQSRRQHLGVLRSPPALDTRSSASAALPGLRRSDEVRQLLRLLDRGVLSEEEFDRQMRKVFARYP